MKRSLLLLLVACGGVDPQFEEPSSPELHPQPTLKAYEGEPWCPCTELGASRGLELCTGVESCGRDGSCRTFCAWVGSKGGGA